MSLEPPDYIRSLVPYVPGKPIEEAQREFGLKKVIKLASNENPLGSSPRAIRAVKLACNSAHLYPDASGYLLRQALGKHLKKNPDQIILGNGSNEIIEFLIRTYCVPGDQIVTPLHAFIAYRISAQIHGVTTVVAEPAQMLAQVYAHPRVKLIFIANPNNPTGNYWNREQLFSFLIELSRTRKGQILTVLDYAYWEYVTAKDLPSPDEILEKFPHQVVILRTFSKAYGLAGLRIGYGYGSKEVIAPLQKVRQPFNMSSLALAGAEAALLDQAFVKRSVKLNRDGMKFLEKGLKELKIPFVPSQGNFILIDVQKAFKKTGLEVFESCLKQGVILRPVANYGLSGSLRLSVGAPAENRKALRVLKLEAGA